MTLAQGGDIEAQRIIVESLGLLVLGYANRWGYRNPDRILDNFQEGILGIYKAFEKYRFGLETRFITFATYCIRTAMHTAYARNRNWQNRRVSLPAEPRSFAPPVWARTELAEQQQAWRDYVTKLLAKVQSLEPRHASLVLATLYNGESTKDVAARSGCTRQRIQQILAKSKQRLADRLDPCPPEVMPRTWDYACCG